MLSFDRFDNTVRFYLFHFYVLYCSRYQSANTIYYNSNFFDYRFDVVVLINLNIYSAPDPEGVVLCNPFK